MGAGEAGYRPFCNCMGSRDIRPFSSSHIVIYSPSQNSVNFPSILLSLPQPYGGIFSSRRQKVYDHQPCVLLGRGECGMSAHICTRLPRRDQAAKKTISQRRVDWRCCVSILAECKLDIHFCHHG